MAIIAPTLPTISVVSGGMHAELSLLRTLELGLSNAYLLFHSVDWSRGSGQFEQHGEVDIVVVNQAGDTLVIEVKSGQVDFQSNGIFKTYDGKVKDVTRQINLQYGALRGRLNDAGLKVKLQNLLVLPDVRVKSETAQWPRERIVDSQELNSICARISDLIGPGLPNPVVFEKVSAFFENRFSVMPDVTALLGRLQQEATKLSSGLATWVPRIEVPSGVVRVVGTAGSGKTQLALKLLQHAVSNKLSAGYLCYNRALADHISRVVPVQVVAETFHEFAVRVLKSVGVDIDFAAPNIFVEIEANCIANLENRNPDLDLLIIDEVQDFKPEWVNALLTRLKPNGTVFLLEDSDQQLYPDREEFELPDAITITSHENYRSPRSLVKLINGLRLADSEIESKSFFDGEMPNPLVYESSDQLVACTSSAVIRCLEKGFTIDDIAVISMRGRERSVIQKLDQLGDLKVKRFTGRFDESGNPIWTREGILVDSVRRFKGQAAPAVIFTECDFETFTDINRKLLFVGITRARIHLEWVISSNLEKLIEQRLM